RSASSRELERIGRGELRVAFHECVRISQLLNSLARRHASVVLALVTHPQVVFELANIQQLAAALVLATHPQPVAALVRGRWSRLPGYGHVLRRFTEQIAHVPVAHDSSTPLPCNRPPLLPQTPWIPIKGARREN